MVCIVVILSIWCFNVLISWFDQDVKTPNEEKKTKKNLKIGKICSGPSRWIFQT